MKVFTAIFALSVVAVASAGQCDNPKLSVASYTPEDAQVLTHIPFLADFTLSCGGANKDIPLYAKVEGVFVQVPRSQDGARYQIGFTREIKKAKIGEYEIPLFDEEGFAALKRASDRGEDAASVRPLATIKITYPGSYRGPYVSSESIAATLSLLVFYFAYTTKAKLLA